LLPEPQASSPLSAASVSARETARHFPRDFADPILERSTIAGRHEADESVSSPDITWTGKHATRKNPL